MKLARLVCALWFAACAQAGAVSSNTAFYHLPAVHTASLTFTPDQWFGLEPKWRDSGARQSGRAPEFPYVHADLVIDDHRLTNVAVRYKGHATFMQSAGTLKRPFKVDLNEFVKGQKIAGASKLNFHNNVADPSWMNEPLAYALFRDAGLPAPRTAYARLYADVTGRLTNQFLGLYSLVENPDGNWAEDRFGTRTGMILKPVAAEPFQFLGESWARYRQAYDPKTPVYETQAGRVIGLARLVSQADDAEFARRLPEFIELDSFSRFLAVTVFLSNLDSILGLGDNHLVYLHPETQRFLFLPWDLDHAFGSYPLAGTAEDREQLSIWHPWTGTNRFLERVFSAAPFREAYVARLREFQQTLFMPDRIARQVAELVPILRPSVELESPAKAWRFDRATRGESVLAVGLRGELPAENTAAAHDTGTDVRPIKAFVKARHASIAAQLEGRSQGRRIESIAAMPATPSIPVRKLAEAAVAAADTDRDGRVSRKEFTGLGERWFAEWDSARGGVLTETALSAGLDRLIDGGTVSAAGFGPGALLARAWLSEFDRDRSNGLSRAEFATGFQRWFDAWGGNRDGALEPPALLAGLHRNLNPFAGPGGGL
jgi:spore coat protein H